MSSLPITIRTDEGLVITVKENCITKETAEVIVNSTRDDLNLKSGNISKAIYKAAGHSIQEECSQKFPDGIKRGHVCVTGSGNLPCGTIYHGALSPWLNGNGEADLLAFIRCFLDHGSIEGKRSIAIPAITTGNLEFPPDVVARVMHQEILKFSRHIPTTSLKDIRIVLVPGPQKDAFVTYFSGVATNSSRPNSGTERATIPQPDASGFESLLSGIFSSRRPVSASGRTADTILSVKTTKGMTMNIKKGSIAEAQTDVIVNMTTKDLRLNHGAISSSIFRAAGSQILQQCKANAPDGIQYGDMVESSGGRLKCKHIYHGTIREWSSGCGEDDLRELMSTILGNADSDGMTSISFPAMGTGLILGYPANTVAKCMVEEVEEFSSGNPTSSIKIVDFVLYERDAKSLSAFQSFASEKYKVTTTKTKQGKPPVAEFPVPNNWCRMQPDEIYKTSPLSADSEEYKTVAKRFTDKGGYRNIKKIQRIQCPNMFQLFMVRRTQIEKTISDKTKFKVEETLYHGTSGDAVDQINLLGFNRSYSGKNATVLGYGSYFAKDASYSCSDTYSPRDTNGLKHVYQCRVLTGEYTKGSQNLKIPPPKDQNNSSVLYDSVVNCERNPTVFVVFYDAQAYPEYLISFKEN